MIILIWDIDVHLSIEGFGFLLQLFPFVFGALSVVLQIIGIHDQIHEFRSFEGSTFVIKGWVNISQNVG